MTITSIANAVLRRMRRNWRDAIGMVFSLDVGSLQTPL
jgi:hypothetical protein